MIQNNTPPNDKKSGERLSLEDIKKVSTDILFDVHDFCVKHDIKYSLAYGTLIGAIRHKGFIPWDDDVDIIMPRKDFERFCKEYKSPKNYKCLGPDDDDSLIMYARVYDDTETIVKNNVPWCTFSTGIWIDVFPVDGVEAEYDVFMKKVEKISVLSRKLSLIRSVREDFWSFSFKRKIKWFVKKLLTSTMNVKTIKREYRDIICSLDFDNSQFYGQLGCYDSETKFEQNPKYDFATCVEVDFMGRKLLAMNGYDSVLHRYYGDYMKLPPKESQQPKLIDYVDFYWR